MHIVTDFDEKKFILEINNKTFGELDYEEQCIVKYIFPKIKKDSLISSKEAYGYKIKGIIKVNGEIKNISFKRGTSSSMHIGIASKFALKMGEFGLPVNLVVALLVYHFADGTFLGTGTQLYSSYELKEVYKKQIRDIAEAFKKKSLLYKATDYIVREENKKRVDYIIYKENRRSIYIANADSLVKVMCKYKDNLLHPYMRIGVFNYLAWGRDNSSTFERQKRKYYCFIKINNLKKYMKLIDLPNEKSK